MKHLPKFDETYIPILEVLSDGDLLHYKDLIKRVREQYYSELPEELLSKRYKSGDNILSNRINWAKSYLKNAKFLDSPEMAKVQITEKRKDLLESGKEFTHRDLNKDPDFLARCKAKKEEKRAKDEETDVETDVEVENASPQELIDSGSSKIKSQVKEELLENLRNMEWFKFERVVLTLLGKMGYGKCSGTSKTADGGIDGVIKEDQLGLEKIYIQAKHYKEDNKVHETSIRDFIGAMSRDTKKGIFVTTSSFGESAREKARDADHSIILIDGGRLVDLMYQYNVGVKDYSSYTLKKIDEDFFDR